jgi:dihydropteroate synthase
VHSGFPDRWLYTIPLPGARTLRLGERPMVMGVLNITPDSFANTPPLVLGPTVAVEAAVAQACAMEAAGADLIDVGGESTRPGASPVSADEELSRVLPVLEALDGRIRIPVSVDTYKAQVAARALHAGATIVNDVSGLRYDPAVARVAADTGAGLVLMHTRGRPGLMYARAHYDDVLGEVRAELERSIDDAVQAGVERRRIIVDPGIGFAKRAEHSYGVLARLSELAAALERPVLIGPSRKSFLQAAAGERPAIERDWATAAAVAAAVLQGAHIVRVHAVAEMVQVVRVAEAIRRATVTAGFPAIRGTD